MRKLMTIALYEMTDRMEFYVRYNCFDDLCCSMLDMQDDQYRTFWISEDLVVLVDEHALAGVYHFILHLLPTGLIHCVTHIALDNPLAMKWIRGYDTLVEMIVNTGDVWCHRRTKGERGWNTVDRLELVKGHDQPCVSRALTLHAIQRLGL
jgi:hypothetical protein